MKLTFGTLILLLAICQGALGDEFGVRREASLRSPSKSPSKSPWKSPWKSPSRSPHTPGDPGRSKTRTISTSCTESSTPKIPKTSKTPCPTKTWTPKKPSPSKTSCTPTRPSPKPTTTACNRCSVAAATVDIFYWPTPGQPDHPTTVVTNGITYTSPTIYVTFTELSAYDNCGTIGPVVPLTTIGFLPGELSTVQEVATSTGYGTITETASNGQVATTTESGAYYATTTPAALDFSILGQCGKISDYTYSPGNFSTTSPNPCHPTLFPPSQIRNVNRAWETCYGIFGFYDPPTALSHAPALVPPPPPPPTTTTVDIVVTTSIAPEVVTTATTVPTTTAVAVSTEITVPQLVTSVISGSVVTVSVPGPETPPAPAITVATTETTAPSVSVPSVSSYEPSSSTPSPTTSGIIVATGAASRPELLFSVGGLTAAGIFMFFL